MGEVGLVDGGQSSIGERHEPQITRVVFSTLILSRIHNYAENRVAHEYPIVSVLPMCTMVFAGGVA